PPPPSSRRTGSPCRGHRRRYSILSYINNPTILLDTNRRGLRIDWVSVLDESNPSDFESHLQNALKFGRAFIVDTLKVQRSSETLISDDLSTFQTTVKLPGE
ncbi:hypothetical protein, partial [Neisseria sicca]|uniref:hypothetical protein n=1 Tax=Neisseria sicca TaxID=490 RepID=UPI003621DD80